MTKNTDAEVEVQRGYYAKTASEYDRMHISAHDEHGFALSYMISVVDYLAIESILDIGSGTGRALITVKSKVPHVKIVGIEPSRELREVGYSKGITDSDLIDGDATNLQFADGSFDLVCEYAALHHIPKPHLAISEMLRVSKRAIFISDCNNFGQGSRVSRYVKQIINAVGLWSIADYIKTKGKGYTISDGDGLAYSYSVFNDYARIKSECKSVHFLNTINSGPNLFVDASHVALLGIK
jgi:ubiquinone/menaquinone biosynthesis C-methylase UbiE